MEQAHVIRLAELDRLFVRLFQTESLTSFDLPILLSLEHDNQYFGPYDMNYLRGAWSAPAIKEEWEHFAKTGDTKHMDLLALILLKISYLDPFMDQDASYIVIV